MDPSVSTLMLLISRDTEALYQLLQKEALASKTADGKGWKSVETAASWIREVRQGLLTAQQHIDEARTRGWEPA